LVQAIVKDLIDVGKKYSQIRKQAEEKEKTLHAQLDPLKLENDRLTKENNELHLQIIETKEELQQKQKSLQSHNEQLQLEKNEINVLLNQKSHKIKNQEMTINNLKKKMNAVLSSTGTAHQQLIGKTARISFNASPLSASSKPRTRNGEKIGNKFGEFSESKDDEDHDDRYKLLESENQSLLTQMHELTALYNEEKSKLIELEAQLKERNEEISRMHDTLHIDDNRIEYIKYQQDRESQSSRMKHLESQIEVLQSEMTEKEREIQEYAVKDEVIGKLKAENKELNSKLEIAWSELDKLKLDLASIKQNNKALKLEKKYDIIGSSKKLHKEVSEITLLQNKLEELSKANKVLESRLAQKSKQHSILSERSKEGKASKHTLNVALELKEKELDKLQADKVDLLRQCEDLKAKMNETQHEMEVTRHSVSKLQMQLKSSENAVSVLEAEKADWQRQYEEMKRLHGETQREQKEVSTINESLNFKVRCLEKEKASLEEEMSRMLAEKSTLQRAETQKQSEKFELAQKVQHMEFANEDLKKEKEWNEQQMVQYEAKLAKLEAQKKELSASVERANHTLNECKLKYNELEYKHNSQQKRNEELQSKLKQSEQMISSLKVVQSQFDVTSQNKNHLELELIRLQNENEKYKKELEILQNDSKRREQMVSKMESEKAELKLILQQMQQRMVAFQQRLSAVNADRDHIKRQYDEVMAEMNGKNERIDELNAALNELRVEYTKCESKAKHLEKQWQETQQSLSNKESVCRDATLKIDSFHKMHEQLKQSVQQEMAAKQLVQQTVHELQRENEEMASKYEQLRVEYQNLAESVVPSMKQEMVLQQVQTGELKVLCNKLDDGHKSAQTKIEQLYHKKQELIHLLQCEQEKVAALNGNLQRAVAEKESAKTALQNLVGEHDQLENELDKQVEMMQVLQGKLESEQSKNAEFQQIVSETQQQYRQQHKQLIAVTQKLKQSEQAIHKFERQTIPQLREESKLKAQQLSNALNDLNNVTKENQFLNNEYAQTINDRDCKNNQLSTTLNKVLYLESQLTNLQNEKKQILENYSAIIAENEKLQKMCDILETHKSEFTVKIATLEQHINGRDVRIKHLETHLSEANLHNHALQRQNQVLTRDLQRIQLNNSKNETLSENLQKDLSALQNEVVQKQQKDIEKKNALIQRFKTENKNLQKMISELNLEKEVAFNSLQVADNKMKKLEDIIKELRIDNLSNNNEEMIASRERDRHRDDASKLKRELNQIKELNQRLSSRLHKIQQHHHT